MPSDLHPGYTTGDLAARFRVSPDKILGFIRRGELRAINTATNLCGRPRYVVTHDALAEFERRRAGHTPPKPKVTRQRPQVKDYYPD